MKCLTALQPTVEYWRRQWIHCWSSPGAEADRNTKVQNKNKKPNSTPSAAGATAVSELLPIVSASSPACSNTFISGCFLQCWQRFQQNFITCLVVISASLFAHRNSPFLNARFCTIPTKGHVISFSLLMCNKA